MASFAAIYTSDIIAVAGGHVSCSRGPLSLPSLAPGGRPEASVAHDCTNLGSLCGTIGMHQSFHQRCLGSLVLLGHGQLGRWLDLLLWHDGVDRLDGLVQVNDGLDVLDDIFLKRCILPVFWQVPVHADVRVDLLG